MNYLVVYCVVLTVSLFCLVNARIHHLSLSDDTREQVTISRFGYLRNGVLQVNVAEFSFMPRSNLEALKNSFSFVFEKTKNGGFSSFSDNNKQEFCNKYPRLVNKTQYDDQVYTMILFHVDLAERKVFVKHFGKDLANMQISSTFVSSIGFNDPLGEKPDGWQSSSAAPAAHKARRDTAPSAPTSKNESTPAVEAEKSTESKSDSEKYGFDTYKPIESIQFTMNNKSSISFKFEIDIKTYAEEGLYILNFFNCFQQRASELKSAGQPTKAPGQDGYNKVNELIERDIFTRLDSEPRISFNLELDLLERNEDSYLSAGEMPEPTLYLTWSIIFFLAGLSWMYILKASKGDVFKIHYLMLGLVFIKSISLSFHAINMHYIAVNGRHEAIWAILFYITYFLRGLLLIVSILLVGTGWTFVKHILTENERRLFVIVIPLQILVITAYIFLEEKEEGDAVYATWRQLMFMLDLLCCGAILFPVVWSIKHLEQASKTDGKMVANLRKLRIFKHFYIMVICYIYFTRIIGYLLKQILPFRYEWFDEFCSELVTFTFFALTAYKFQPASNNPYLQLTQEDENALNELNNDDEAEVVMDLIEHDYSEAASGAKADGNHLPSGPDSSNPTLFSRKQFIPSTQI